MISFHSRLPDAPLAAAPAERGALVISLDFELRWGVRDRMPWGHRYEANLRGVWEAVPKLLDLFRAYDVAATWAIVGFLLASSEAERHDLDPPVRPTYHNPRLDPYQEVGTDVGDRKAVHYAPDLVAMIARTPRQEIATHTYSHYYCSDPGSTVEAFTADLAAARRAAVLYGYGVPRSIVFPRNQHNPDYDELLTGVGIDCFRGNPAGSGSVGTASRVSVPLNRLRRLVGAYFDRDLNHTYSWDELRRARPPVNIPATQFVRPFSPSLALLEPVRIGLLKRRVLAAGRAQRVVHLWWHPHNMGVHTSRNLTSIQRVLDSFAEARERFGMKSLTMAEAAGACLPSKAA